MAVCKEQRRQREILLMMMVQVKTDLALDIPDEQLHVIRPLILVCLLSSRRSDSRSELLRSGGDEHPARSRRRSPRGHAHVETVRHATSAREQ
jgi:hypothetical protein